MWYANLKCIFGVWNRIWNPGLDSQFGFADTMNPDPIWILYTDSKSFVYRHPYWFHCGSGSSFSSRKNRIQIRIQIREQNQCGSILIRIRILVKLENHKKLIFSDKINLNQVISQKVIQCFQGASGSWSTFLSQCGSTSASREPNQCESGSGSWSDF